MNNLYMALSERKVKLMDGERILHTLGISNEDNNIFLINKDINGNHVETYAPYTWRSFTLPSLTMCSGDIAFISNEINSWFKKYIKDDAELLIYQGDLSHIKTFISSYNIPLGKLSDDNKFFSIRGMAKELELDNEFDDILTNILDELGDEVHYNEEEWLYVTTIHRLFNVLERKSLLGH